MEKSERKPERDVLPVNLLSTLSLARKRVRERKREIHFLWGNVFIIIMIIMSEAWASSIRGLLCVCSHDDGDHDERLNALVSICFEKREPLVLH